MNCVSHLECSHCGNTLPPGHLYNLCPDCRSPLLVRYDLEAVGRRLTKTDLLDRPPDMWRYLEVMPVDEDQEIVTLGEGLTPLLPLVRLGRELGLEHLYIKDEAINPTGSFKARGLSAAVTMARKLGAESLCIPTAGNAGGALAAYCAQAGLQAHIFMPRQTPLANVMEARLAGAQITQVEGVITDAGRAMSEKMATEGWFDVSTLKEPYRIEGKKTMGYELAEQFSWKLPDVVIYPTGGGTGLIGMWKAFAEMEQLGWIGSERPRMVSVQSEGCAPIVQAWEQGAERSRLWEEAETFAAGIRVPKAIGDFIILRNIRESAGCAVAVSETAIYEAIRQVGSSEGIFLCPEGAACWAALLKLQRQNWIQPGEKIVVFNTGAGHKYIDSIQGFEDQSG